MEPVLISAIDLLLVPLYFIILLFFIIYLKKKHHHNKLVQQYLVKAFLFKIFGGLLYALLVYYYWGFGDTATYFKETLLMKKLLSEGRISLYHIFWGDYSFFRENFDMIGAVNESGFLVVKVSFILSYFGLNSFLACTMLMATLALAGIFKLFEAFVSFAPQWHFFIACIVLFFPSLNIYGSGILKDTLCFTALGWFFYSCINISKGKRSFSDYIIILISLYFIIVIKAYIIAGFAIPFIMFICMTMLKKIEVKFIRVLAFPLILLFFAGIIAIFYNSINEKMGEFAVDKIQENVGAYKERYAELTEDADSNFDIGEIEPTIGGILKKMPVGITATLYRPFIWEIKKPIMLLTGLESIFIALFSLYVLKKVGVRFFLKKVFSDPIIFLCFFFAIIFSGFVGITALNFGTLARYRIPVIPFYLFSFLLVLYQHRLITQKNIAGTEVE